MARVFLDANYFIGLVNRTPETEVDILEGHKGYISALSCHILCYVNKIKLPDKKIQVFAEDFFIVNLTDSIIQKAFASPTADMEDNIQLHSAVEADCDYFLTSDKKLLAMIYFGKTKIVSTLQRA
ncbi:hypothetical protein HY087_00890 [Candidatus Gottesmanbacteria bacterium]|nr:hypothetical protein [Candidatus Gottesmanbacteria bacterium]